jgi:glycine hydroxymethyltransferase
MDEFGKAYADQVISNANCLGQELARRGYSLRTADKQAWTNNHQVHLFRDEHNVRLVEMFVANNISINTSRALGDSLFVRLGVQEVTRRGMKDAEMSTIADFISAVLAGQEVSYRVREFARSYTKVRYGYSLDR